jgi:UDP-glucose 4-epimerase
VVQANLLAMEREVRGTLNIASGTRTSVNELARTLQEILGVDRELRYGPPRPGDIRDSWADITRARRMLGFRPRYTLREGLEAMVAGGASGNGSP